MFLGVKKERSYKVMFYGKETEFNTKGNIKDLQVDYGKMPPQAVDLEEAVLGALMLEKDSFSIVGDLLEPDVFIKMHINGFSGNSQTIYQ